MKKILALMTALALCVCTAAAFAETTVQSKVIEAYNLELNTKTNTLVMTDGKTYEKFVVDTEGNKLSDGYAYVSSNEGYFTAKKQTHSTTAQIGSWRNFSQAFSHRKKLSLRSKNNKKQPTSDKSWILTNSHNSIF